MLDTKVWGASLGISSTRPVKIQLTRSMNSVTALKHGQDAHRPLPSSVQASPAAILGAGRRLGSGRECTGNTHATTGRRTRRTEADGAPRIVRDKDYFRAFEWLLGRKVDVDISPGNSRPLPREPEALA